MKLELCTSTAFSKRQHNDFGCAPIYYFLGLTLPCLTSWLQFFEHLMAWSINVAAHEDRRTSFEFHRTRSPRFAQLQGIPSPTQWRCCRVKYITNAGSMNCKASDWLSRGILLKSRTTFLRLSPFEFDSRKERHHRMHAHEHIALHLLYVSKCKAIPLSFTILLVCRAGIEGSEHLANSLRSGACKFDEEDKDGASDACVSDLDEQPEPFESL